MLEIKVNKLKRFFDDRTNIFISITIIIVIVFICTLFNLQVINGKSYRERSSTRILRDNSLAATRGEIYYRGGEIAATSKLSFDVLIYRVDITEKERNDIILSVIKILESNGDGIHSTFPINSDYNNFYDGDLTRFKKDMKFEEDITFDEVIDSYIERYELESYDRLDAIKIINVRYEASLRGYSLFNPVTISKDISENSLAMIEESKNELYGINTKSLPKRYYPESYLIAHTVGYVSSINQEEYNILKDKGYTFNDDIGKSGIELTFEEYIKGKDGNVKQEVDSLGNVASEEVINRPINGYNVTLTLDYRLQKISYDSLVQTIEDINEGEIYNQSDATAGSVIVVDVRNGEILASVSYPSFDTNSFVGGIDYKEWNNLLRNELNPMYNRTIAGTYAPGSTYKMLMGVAGLETNKIAKDELIECNGIYEYGHNPKCWIYEMYHRTHGPINVKEAIKVSCNYFFYEVGRRVGIEDMVKYSKIFGLGEKTGVEILGEVDGTIAGNTDKDWYLGDTLSAAIGQSYNSYTPLQIVNYVSAIANKGTLNSLTYIKDIVLNEDSYITSDEIINTANDITGTNYEKRKIDVSEESLNIAAEGMLAVTEEGGTSYNTFKDFDIQVAGKTGTAQLGNGFNNGIFVGFAPYNNPEIAIVAVIENGGSGVYVANVVKPIMQEYFNIIEENKSNKNLQNILDKDITF